METIFWHESTYREVRTPKAHNIFWDEEVISAPQPSFSTKHEAPFKDNQRFKLQLMRAVLMQMTVESQPHCDQNDQFFKAKSSSLLSFILGL